MRSKLRREDGSEVLEFALALPVVLLAVAAIVYTLVAVAAQASLAHATSSAARYATIPSDTIIDAYPTPDDVADHIAANTPFFDTASCVSTVTGTSVQNAVVAVEADCVLPNPLGRVVNALTGGTSVSEYLTLSARAETRRE